MFAYFPALNVLDARALYSDHPVRDLMDPSVKGTRSSLERHQLFAVAYLKSIGIDDQRDYNQITIVEWGDNVATAPGRRRPPASAYGVARHDREHSRRRQAGTSSGPVPPPYTGQRLREPPSHPNTTGISLSDAATAPSGAWKSP